MKRKSVKKALVVFGVSLLSLSVSCVKSDAVPEKNESVSRIDSVSSDSIPGPAAKTRITVDTSTAKHTIRIENVNDPRELQQILSILESYSAEHNLSGLDIQYLKSDAEIDSVNQKELQK